MEQAGGKKVIDETERPDRRAAILEVAAERFTSRGYVEASMRELAQLLGIKASSLYYHFPSKEALLFEVCKIGVHSLVEYLENLLARPMPLNARILGLFEYHLEMLQMRGNYLVVYMRHRHQLPPDALAELGVLHESYRTRIDSFIMEAQATGAANNAVSCSHIHYLLVAVMKQLNDIYFSDRNTDLHELCRDTALVISKGLAPAQ